MDLDVTGRSGRIAIVDGARKLTYADLDALVADAAVRVAGAGMRSGDRVALVLESSWQYVVCLLAVLRAGGVAVPLNPGARVRDIEAWISFAEARLVISEASHPQLSPLRAQLAARARLMVCGGEDDPLDPPGGEAARPTPVTSPDDAPACILFTSGTTGEPKGVLLSHGNLRSNARSIVESLGLTADDSIACVLPFFYAYGNSVLFSHLTCGASIHVQRGFTFPHAVMDMVARHGITGFAGVPSTFALLLSRVKLESCDLSGLRYVAQAGGAMPPALVSRLAAALPGKQVFIMYGQTEATARLTCLPAARLADKPGSVGLPVRDVRIEIRDATGRVCGAGETGDIWACGPNIMQGYWRNPEATAQVLRDGWLRTGDIGRLDEEGFVHIVGRRSDIIKVGAHRVHPQDVEHVLAELSTVGECAVVGVADDLLGEVIKAFIVPAAGTAPHAHEVRRHCLENLPNYKVPKFIEFVACLPRTPSGKVQRAALLNRESTG